MMPAKTTAASNPSGSSSRSMRRNDTAATNAARSSSIGTDGATVTSHTSTATAMAMAASCQMRKRTERDIGVNGGSALIIREWGCGLWVVGYGLWDVGCGMWEVGCGRWVHN